MGESSPAESVDGRVTTRRRWPWLLAFAGATIVTAALIGVFTAEPGAEPEAEPAQTPTDTVEPEPTPESELEQTVEITSTETMAYSSVWNPPDEGQDFWRIVDPENGYPDEGGTDFVLAHACATEDCTGDELRGLEVGDTLIYLGERYEIQDKRAVWKSEIAQQDIWYHDPDRIVLVTCIIEEDGQDSEKNDLLIATRI